MKKTVKARILGVMAQIGASFQHARSIISRGGIDEQKVVKAKNLPEKSFGIPHDEVAAAERKKVIPVLRSRRARFLMERAHRKRMRRAERGHLNEFEKSAEKNYQETILGNETCY